VHVDPQRRHRVRRDHRRGPALLGDRGGVGADQRDVFGREVIRRGASNDLDEDRPLRLRLIGGRLKPVLVAEGAEGERVNRDARHQGSLGVGGGALEV
jgi:hypothetical protein